VVFHPLHHSFRNLYSSLMISLGHWIVKPGIARKYSVSCQTSGLLHLIGHRLPFVLKQRDQLSKVVHVRKVDAASIQSALRAFSAAC